MVILGQDVKVAAVIRPGRSLGLSAPLSLPIATSRPNESATLLYLDSKARNHYKRVTVEIRHLSAIRLIRCRLGS
jgi:hypothetical protein